MSLDYARITTLVLVSVDSTAQYRAGSDNGEVHTQRLFRIAGNQLDSQFGSNGVLQIPIDSQWAMQADRTLVSTVVFHQNDPDNEDDDEYVPALAMYDTAGNLDSGFGIAGVATVDEFGGSLLAFQPDGGIVLVRSGPPYACSPTAAVDSSFGSNGIASFYDGPYGYAGFALQLDGKIVLLGVHQGPDDLEELS